MGEMLGKRCGCGISLIGVDCGFFFVENSGCTDGEINVVVCDGDTEVIRSVKFRTFRPSGRNVGRVSTGVNVSPLMWCGFIVYHRDFVCNKRVKSS